MIAPSDISVSDYGEAIKFDRNFKGPLSKRSCTDVICLLIFIIFLCCWTAIGIFSIRNGDLDQLLSPTDSRGLKCGFDSQVLDKPFLVFLSLEKCIDPLVTINGCPTPQVCVRECPSTSFLYDSFQCNQATLANLVNTLICDMQVDKTKIETCSQVDALIKEEKCARWYLPSKSFFKRCISGLPSTECPYIPNSRSRYLQRSTRSTNDCTDNNCVTRSFGDEKNDSFNSLIILSQTKSQKANEPEAKCEERRKLGQEIILHKMNNVDSMLSRFVGNFLWHISSNATDTQRIGQMVVEDIVDSWWQILIALVVAMICCLIFIAIMRWLATPLVWLSIIGVIAMLGAAIYFSAINYKELLHNPPPPQNVSPNLNSFFQSYLSEKNTWLVLLIIFSVLLAIILLVIIFLRKRIVIAIALVKEGSKAVSATTSTVFFPIAPWIFQVAVICYAIIIALYLASIGVHKHEIVRMDNSGSCICTGLGAGYKNGDVCDPKIFNQYCHPPNTRFTSLMRQDVSETCTEAACHFVRLEKPSYVGYLHAVNVVGFFWAVFFITAFGEMVLAATFATWYWTFHKSDVPFFTLTTGLARTFRYHLGTLAFGSLIITICRLIRVVLEYIDHKLKKFDNGFTRAIMCCMKCFFWCLESFLKFINKNAYIMCAIHGKNFCSSAKDAFNLLMRNFLRVIAVDKVTDFLFFLSKVLITLGMGALTYLYFTSDVPPRALNYEFVPSIIVMIGTYLIASVFFGVYSMAVDTLFLCFLEDCERNDGSAEKPYYMSKQLMKILGKKNVIPRNQYS